LFDGRRRLLVTDPTGLTRRGRQKPAVGFASACVHATVRATTCDRRRTLEGKLIRKVALPGKGTTLAMVGLPDQDIGYFAYTSFTEPSMVFRASMSTGAVDEWSRASLPIDTSST
jgi:hypothetical protein